MPLHVKLNCYVLLPTTQGYASLAPHLMRLGRQLNTQRLSIPVSSMSSISLCAFLGDNVCGCGSFLHRGRPQGSPPPSRPTPVPTMEEMGCACYTTQRFTKLFKDYITKQ